MHGKSRFRLTGFQKHFYATCLMWRILIFLAQVHLHSSSLIFTRDDIMLYFNCFQTIRTYNHVL